MINMPNNTPAPRILPAPSRELGAFVGTTADAPRPEESPFLLFHKIHRLLRGRYPIALGLAVLGASVGAAAGYLVPKPKYMSMGLIHVQPVLQTKMYETPEKGMPPMFTSYVKTQANLLLEPLVVDLAFHTPEWRAVGRPMDAEGRDKFLNGFSITTEHDEPEWIRVRFIDPDRKAAKVAVEQLIEAYIKKWGPTMGVFTPDLVNDLKSNMDRLQSEISEYRRRLESVYAANGANLTEIQTALTKEILATQAQVDSLDLQIKQAEAAAADPNAAATPVDPDLANAEIAKVDEEMRSLVNQRLFNESQVERYSQTLTENHTSLKRARAALAGVENQIKTHREAWLKSHGGLPAAGGALALGGVSKEQLPILKKNYTLLKASLDVQLDRNRAISTAKSQVDTLQGDIKKRQEEYDNFEHRLRAITIENPTPGDSGSAGRIQVISKGEEPTRPYSDPRLKLGVLGLALGGGLPIGLFLVVGLLDRRYRYSDDASAPGQVSLLGILPYLPENMADPEQAAVAAHCVHQIRTLLQIGGAHRDRKVFTVTSPTSGDGKTSLSLSLGLSFAASGSRTLMVDFDLVGGGLSSAMQSRTDRGVLDAILKGELNGHVRSTAFPRLSIIPIGGDEAQEVSRLSPSLVRRFLDQAREEYDIVVIDTGPILGSLEASIVSAESDGVILALGRGQQRHQVERAIKHLSSVGATLVGVVFNRAQPGDFRRAVSSASVRSVPVNMNGHGQASMPALGPMARTVASHIRAEEVEGD